MPLPMRNKIADDRPPIALPWSRNYGHFGNLQGKRLVDQGPIKDGLKAFVEGEPIDDPKDPDQL